MKFGKKIGAEAVPEWSSKYIQYADLKRDIKEIQSLLSVGTDQHDGTGATSQQVVTPTGATDHRIKQFDMRLKREVHACTAFFRQQLEELEVSLIEAKKTARLIRNETLEKNAGGSNLRTRICLNFESLILEFIRLGDEAVKLFNFLRLNSEAIRKICKKFKKQTSLHSGSILNKLDSNPSLKRDLMHLKEYPALLEPSIDTITLSMSQLLNELRALAVEEQHDDMSVQHQTSMPMSALAKAQGFSPVTWIRMEQLRQRVTAITRDCDGMRSHMANTNSFLSFLSRGALISPQRTRYDGSGNESYNHKVRWGSSINAENATTAEIFSSIENSSPSVQRRFFTQLSQGKNIIRASQEAEQEDPSASPFPETFGKGVEAAGALSGNLKYLASFEQGRSWSHYLNLLGTFLYLANYNVCLPTSAEYAEHLGMQGSSSGIVVAMTPVAALLSAVVYSYASNFSFRNPLFVSSIFLFIGNAIYAAAWDTNLRYMLLLGRFVTGLGGCRAVNRRYIADTVAERYRTTASAHFVAAGAGGMASGPLLAALFSGIDMEYQGWTFNEVTGPAWTMCFIWILYGFAVLLCFSEPSRPGSKKNRAAAKVGSLPTSPRNLALGLDDDGGDDDNDGNFRFKSKFNGDDQDDDDDDDLESLESLLALDHDFEFSDSEDSVFDDSIDIVLETTDSSQTKSSTTYGSMSGDFHTRGAPFDSSDTAASKVKRNGRRNANSFYAEETGLLPVSKATTFAERVAKRRTHLTVLSLWVILWMKLVQEALLTAMPVQGRTFGWQTRFLGLLMASFGVIVVPANLLLVAITRAYLLKDAFWIHYLLVLLLLFSLPLAFLFNITWASLQAPLLIICDLGVFVSAQVSEAVVSSFFSKVISKRLAAGTFNSGFLATEAGTFGRACGNALITALGAFGSPENMTENLNLVFSFVTLISIVATGLLLNKKHISWQLVH